MPGIADSPGSQYRLYLLPKPVPVLMEQTDGENQYDNTLYQHQNTMPKSYLAAPAVDSKAYGCQGGASRALMHHGNCQEGCCLSPLHGLFTAVIKNKSQAETIVSFPSCRLILSIFFLYIELFLCQFNHHIKQNRLAV
jgi:hypothetical protein